MNMTKDVAELRARAKEVVAQFDADNSGSFDRKEIAKCLRYMGMELSDKEMRAYTKSLFKKLDMDGSNSIGFDEFFEFFQNCLATETDRKKFLLKVQRRALSRREKSAAKNAFKAADKDGSNSIDVKEFGSIIKAMGMELTDEQLEEIVTKEFNKRDKDHGGDISFAEFEKLFRHCLVTEEKKASYQKKVFLSKAEKDAAKDMFRKYDSDGSGQMDMSEIEHILKDLGLQGRWTCRRLNIF